MKTQYFVAIGRPGDDVADGVMASVVFYYAPTDCIENDMQKYGTPAMLTLMEQLREHYQRKSWEQK